MSEPIEVCADSPQEISILLVEDNPCDARVVRECLSEGLSEGFLLDRTKTLGQALDHLRRFDYDVALVDLALPDSTGVATVDSILTDAPGLALVVLTGLTDENTALDCVRAGAQDYVVKGEHGPEILVRTVRFAIKRNQADEALRESEARYRRLFERNLAGVYQTDAEGHILDCNDAFVKILGARSRREILEQPAWDLYLDPDQAEGLTEALSRQGEIRNCVIDFRRVDGQPVRVQANLTRVDANGYGMFVQGTVFDVTEHRELEDRLYRSRKMEAIGRLAGGVAHDFNNILTSITGYTELSLLDTDPDNPVHDNLREIREASRRAALLTRQLQAFGRRPAVKAELLDINQLVASFEKLIATSVGEHIATELSLESGVGRIRADRGQIEIALVDLVMYAGEAMPGGGALIIETSKVTLDSDFVKAHPGASTGPHVRLSLRASRTGGKKGAIRCFVGPRLARSEAEECARLTGTHGIVRRSGGWLAVEREPGEGVTSRVFLPVCDEAAASPGARCRESGDAAADHARILLVEDDEALRMMGARVLKREGFEVKAASEPAEALEIVARDGASFDLLLADLVMPGMSGRDLAITLIAEQPDLKVLLVSGYPEDACLVQESGSARMAFMEKPFRPTELVNEVRAVLSKARAASTAGHSGLVARDVALRLGAAAGEAPVRVGISGTVTNSG